MFACAQASLFYYLVGIGFLSDCLRNYLLYRVERNVYIYSAFARHEICSIGSCSFEQVTTSILQVQVPSFLRFTLALAEEETQLVTSEHVHPVYER